MTIAGALFGALTFTTVGSAAEPIPAHIEACTSLRRDSERLACYDKAVAIMRAAGETAAPPSAENMFGANTEITQSGASHAAVKREELQQISGMVTSLRRMDDGMIQLELDNGQVWRQQDAEVRLMVETGDKITVVRASMGTFRIADKTGRFARFRRVR
jgi:TolA-binding protein